MTGSLPDLVLNTDEISAFLAQVFPEYEQYGIEIEALVKGKLTASMQVKPQHLRPGGTVSGITMFALADLAAFILILGHIGEVALAVTTSVNINFVRKPSSQSLRSECEFIKLGRTLAVCNINIYAGDDPKMVSQATATYSIPSSDS